MPTMKNTVVIFTLLLLFTLLTSAEGGCAKTQKTHTMEKYTPGNDYAADWKKVAELEGKGLTEDARKVVKAIYEKAKAENNAAQTVKAVFHLYKYSVYTEENNEQKIVDSLKMEIAAAKYPLQPVLQSVLADIYWQYFQQNRYRILNRTEVKQQELPDFQTWDANRFTREITQLFLASLSNAEQLKQTPVDVYDAVLVKAQGARPLRPTLYDLLAHRACDYFSNDQANITKAADQFTLSSPDAFAPANVFAAATFTNTDELSVKYHALTILQQLLNLHLTSGHIPALIDADLKRLEFARQTSVLPDKDERYFKALLNLEKQHIADTASANVSYQIAQYYDLMADKYVPGQNELNKFDRKKAIEICDATIARFPKSRGANNCAVLKDQMLSKSLGFTIEQANQPETPIRAQVTYRNVQKIYGKTIAVTPEVEAKTEKFDRDDQLLEYYNSLPVISSWSVALPDDGDYQTHTAEVKIPKSGIGKLLVMLSTNDNFSYNREALTWHITNITNLSCINRAVEDKVDYFAISRFDSRPLPNVDYAIAVNEYNYNTRKYETKVLKSGKTDANGSFSYTKPKDFYSNLDVTLTQGKDKFSTSQYSYSYYNEPQSTTRTFFFTDRSIYRPGQTVYFKGITIQTNGKNNNLLTNSPTTVVFNDVNSQKIAEQNLKTNEFGSFSGSFTIPSNLLNGNMTIYNQYGSTNIQVEEYKRPKFEVTFNPLKGSYKLNETVTVTGVAKAYAGNNIDNAQVSYRVKRNAVFPYWWWWWRPMPSSDEQEIAIGTAVTNENGEFTIKFTALPDLTVKPADKPQFNYTVYADVTDINGETRSNELTVSVGTVSMLASVNLPDELNRQAKPAFGLYTTNLAGEPEPAKVTVNIHRLKHPEKTYRDRLWQKSDKFTLTKEEFTAAFANDEYDNENNPDTWERAEQVYSKELNTATDTAIAPNNLAQWKPGRYLATLTATDAYGEKVEWKKVFTVFANDDEDVPANELFWSKLSADTAEPGQTISLLFGSAAPDAYFLFEVEHDGKIIRREWLPAGSAQKLTNVKVEEAYRGNFVIHIALVKYNRFFNRSYTVTVPWSNKQLTIEKQTFRSKLYPGQKEEWQLKISGPKGDKVAAEMLAGMYDASLDAFMYHGWNFSIYPYYYMQSSISSDGGFSSAQARLRADYWNESKYRYMGQDYESINNFDFYLGSYGYRTYYQRGRALKSMAAYDMAAPAGAAPPAPAAEMAMDEAKMEATNGMVMKKKNGHSEEDAQPQEPGGGKTKGGGDEVQIRKNLQETAFFLPQLKTDEKGSVIISFTAPEALTRWKFMGLAHTKDLSYGMINEEVVTQKDLMVMPNAPRFLRENDDIYLSAKISNLTENALAGNATLQLFDALTMKPVDNLFLNNNAGQSFNTRGKQSASVSWKLKVPESVQAVVFRIIAKSGSFSDGEENALPVLTNRMLVTESLPLPVRGQGTTNFTFANLAKADKSNTLRHQSLTLEFTSQPAWYAVQALPYLMEYPHECTEQIFSRYYANSLAAHVANSSPRIAKVFETWKNEAITASTTSGKEAAGALLSNLEKNQELKQVLLQETPWVLQAKNETERKNRLGVLFDLDRMGREFAIAEKELQQRQTVNGGWSWFPGMPESWYISQHIVAGMGHLDHLKVKSVRQNPNTWNMVQKAVQFIDGEADRAYRDLLRYKVNLDANNLSYLIIHYLYARSFFTDVELNPEYKTSFDYWMGQAEKYWLGNSKYMQGMIALALNRQTRGDNKTAFAIMESLKQNATRNPEMGMYYKDNAGGWYWYQAPIETQALLIEAFNDVTKDEQSVEDMKVWLLKQKQTQDWKTTKATAEACYALLLTGDNWLASEQLATITVGKQTLNPAKMPELKAEAGTGYFKTTWPGDQITADMGNIAVNKPDKGVAWGAMYWQYFEQLDKITAAETPLAIKKQLFLEKNTLSGKQLVPLTNGATLKVGDVVKARIEIRVDRDMEYVHLKDMRASGFEPMNVISTYRWQDGLGYYETTKDAATNFFMDWLPKGTYVFEYPMRVSHKGNFSNGITTMQCMYAPEFNTHSEGIRVTVE